MKYFHGISQKIAYMKNLKRAIKRENFDESKRKKNMHEMCNKIKQKNMKNASSREEIERKLYVA